MSTLGTYVHSILDQSREEARSDGSTTVEAQHLLLAIASGPDTSGRQLLAAAGLDRAAIRNALDREFEHSLAAAGTSATAFDLQRSSVTARPTRLGASARLALQRGFGAQAKKKDLQPAHLLIGILQAQFGTVPRALALAGVDRDALADRARQAVGDTSS